MATRSLPSSREAGDDSIRDSHDAAARVLSLTWPAAHEAVLAVFVDAKLGPIRTEWIGEGAGASTPLFTRRLLAIALATEARALVLAHNHPSGCLHPSPADLRLTRVVARLLAAVGVRLLDHLIVDGADWRSMRDDGLI